MKTIIQSNDFRLTRPLKQFIERIIRKSLVSCVDQVERISIRLRDINGPKGGNDKECCVEISLSNAPSIVVKKRHADAYASIRNALGRASRVTVRRITKIRSRKTSNVKAHLAARAQF